MLSNIPETEISRGKRHFNKDMEMKNGKVFE